MRPGIGQISTRHNTITMEPRLLVLLALASAAIAGPINVQQTNECATECPASTKLTYAPGTTYVYDYRVDYSTSMSGASEDSAKLTLTTTAELEVLGPCEMALSLRDTRLFHSDAMGGLKAADNEESFRRGMEASPLRFSYQDGAVEHICTATREEPWVMNVKKGVLSAFQNNMDDLSKDQNVTETDVTGTCKTEYTSVSNGYYSDSVRKTKDILTCTDRHDYRTILQMVPYTEPSELQSIPLMKTTHECDQVIQREGVLQSSTCTETHVYRPFSNGQSGGATSVRQTLTYKTYKRSVVSKKDTISSTDSLLFDHSASRPSASQARQQVEQKLKEICESTSYDVRPESPRLFSELVYALKALDKQTMDEMFRQLKTKTLCPSNNKAYKTFLDALPVVSTSSSVGLMTSFILNEDVDELQAGVWIPSLAFIKAPTSEMLIEAKPLLDSDKFGAYALLPASSMVNNFCFRSNACDQSYAVLSMMASLEGRIPEDCDASGKDFHKILLTLRAIGNAGHASRAVPVIAKCLTNSRNPLEIRVAAANAFRRMPCDAEQTSDPHKQMVARALESLVIPTKYMSNPIKASTNLEASALINKINTGFVAESNLVWSNNAQVPRSASANLTVELFGQSINLVDFGGRFEGLEHLIKNIWGSKDASRAEKSEYRGSVYGRVFGNEMFFMHSDQIKLPTEKPSDTWLQMLIGLKEKQELAYGFSKELMDVSMFIPSVAGLPINIEVNGSAVVDLLLKGKADVLNLAVSPRSMDIDGEIRPSAALEITGTMSVDAHVTKTGLRMRNTLHTSTSLKGRIQLERGGLFNVEFDSPKEKMELIEASEGPYFPLTGPSSASLILRKTDTHSGYKLLVKKIQTRQQSVAQISFNTPGSRTNRVILIDLTADRPRNSLSAQVVTPWKKMEYLGYAIDTDETKAVSGTLTVDNTDIYGLTAEVKISQSKRRIHLSPLVVIRRPGQDKIELSGFIAKKGFKSLDVDLSLSGLQELPYNIKTSVSNGNEEKSIHASVSADGGKSVYSIEAGSALRMPQKKITVVNMKNSLKINTPKRNIVLVDAAASYKQDSMLNFDGTLDIHKLMKRPASLKVNVKQQTKKTRGTVYTVSTSVKSSPVTGRFSSNISQKKRLYSTKTVLDYSIPKVSKNKITLAGKIRDKSTSSFTKYTVTGNFDVKKNPEYNAAVNVDLDHKKRHTDLELKVQYGEDPQDKTKTLYFNSVVDRKVRSYKDVKLAYKVEADAPEYDVDFTISGKHEHNPSLLDSKLNVAYGNGKEFKQTIYLKNKNKNKDHYVGQATIAWPGAEYMVNSNLKEVGKKHYTGELNMKSADGAEHSIDGEYKMTSPKTHELTTKMSFSGYKRLVLSGSTGMHKKNPQVSGQIQYGKDAYGLSASAKALKNNAGEMVVELTNPDRRMVLKLDGEKSKHQYEGSLVASWDADKDENKKITITGSTYNKKSKKMVSVGGDMKFTSPFENFENFASSFKYGTDRSQHDILGKMSMGEDKYMTKVTLQKPISMEHLSGSIEAETPFKEMRKLSAQIFHTWQDKVSTVVKGTLNNENAMLDVKGKGGFKDFNGKVIFTSSIENAEELFVTVSHVLNPEDVNSLMEVSHNNKLYRGNLVGNFVRNGWHMKTDGSLTFNSPDSEFFTSWVHKNGQKRINSKFDGKWNEDKLNLHLTASRDSHTMEKLTGELKIDSSRKQLRDVVISFIHKHGDNILKTKAEITKKGKTKALSDIKILKSDKKAGLDFTLKSPYHKDIEGNVDAKYNKYPMTAYGELKWSNNKRLAATTTLNVEQWDDASLEITLDTPSRNYKNTILRASNKKEGHELVSHASLEYGKGKNFDLEARGAFNDQTKMARLRFSTPFEQIKSLDTGLRFDGKATDFESNADFELLPLVEKLRGTTKLQYGDDLTSFLRLDTPYPEYPYLELSASNYGEGRGRKSHIEARLHPQKVYSADAAYSFELPISVDVNVNSPQPEYDNIGFVLQHNHSPSSVASFGELRYQSGKKIESELNADWSSNIEGSMLVKTPFPSYETSKVTLRHQGEWSDFSSHGEIEVAEKSVVADATFKAGDHTEGDFSLSSPIHGMEKLSINVMKKGSMKNFKGEVTVFVNDEKTEFKYDHKLKKKLFQTSFKINSPNTKPIKFSVEHKLQGDHSFTNEISASYGRKYQIDTDLTISCNCPDFQSQGSVKYKLGKRNNVARFTFNKFGELKDMSFNGNSAFNDEEINVYGTWKTMDGLEADVQLNTPFDGFKKTGVTLSHQGDLGLFKSTGSVTYMDNKKINGMFELTTDMPRMGDLSGFSTKTSGNLDSDRFYSEISRSGPIEDITISAKAGYKDDALSVTGSWNSQRGYDGSLEVLTPFEGYESTRVEANGALDEDYKDVSGKVTLTTTISDFGTGDISLSKSGSLDDLFVVGSMLKNNDELAYIRITNTDSETELHTTVNSRGTLVPAVLVNLDVSGDINSFESKVKATVDNTEIIDSTVHFDKADDTIKAGAMVSYNVDENGPTVSSLSIEKEGQLDDITIKIVSKHDGEEITVDGNMNLKEDKTGSLTIRTPYEYYKKVGMSFSHGWESDRLSSEGRLNLVDGEQYFGKVTLNRNDQTGFVEATMEISTPIEGAKFTKAEYTHTITKDDVKVYSFVEYGDSEKIVYDLTASVSPKVEINVLIQTPFEGYKEIAASANLETKLPRLSINSETETTVTTIPRPGFAITIKTPLEKYEKVEASMSYEASASKIEFNSKANAGESKHYSLDATFDATEDVTGSVDIKTPIDDFNKVGLSFSHINSNNKVTSEGKVIYMDDKDISGKVEIVENIGRGLTVTAELNTPFENQEKTKLELTLDDTAPSYSAGYSLDIGNKLYSANGKLNVISKKNVDGSLEVVLPIEGAEYTKAEYQHSYDGMRTDGSVSLTYGNSKTISAELKSSKVPKYDATVIIRTPFEGCEEMQGSGTFENKDNKYGTSAFLNLGSDQIYSMTSNLDLSAEPFRASTQISTPFQGYKDLAAYTDIETKLPRLSINSEVSAGEGRKITLTGSLDVSKDITGNIALTTPAEEYSNVGLSFEHSGKWKNFKSEGRVTYKDGKEISGNVQLKLKKNYLNVELKTPFSGHKNMKFEVSERKTEAERTTTTYLKYGRGQVFQTETTVTTIPKPGFAVTIKTPLEKYENLDASVSYEISASKFEFNSKANAGEGKHYSLDAAFDGTNDVTGSVDIKTPIDDFKKVGLSFSHINSNNKILSEGKEKTKLELTLDDTAPSYSAGYSLDIGNKLYSANGKLNVISKENVDGSLEVVLPVEGAEYTKAEYQHNYDGMRTDGSVSLTYGDSKTISGELKSSKVPYYDATVTIRTPFEGYKELQGSATFENKDDKYGTSTSLNLGSDQLYSMTSYLDLSAEPLRASTKISTPFSDFRNMELVYTHQGSINDFRCTGFLSTPITDNINAAANMRYNSLIDMEGSASVKSRFEGMDDLLAEIKVSDISGEKKVRTAIGWTSEKQVVFDATVSEEKTWYKNKVNGEWSLSTPFEAVRKLTMQADHTGKKDKIKQSLSVELNDEKMLDLDTEYKSKSKHVATVTFRKPLPMQYSVTTSSDAGITEAEVVANWNRDTMDSNVRITASHNDQSDSYKTERNVDIALEFASRKMGVVHKLSSTAPLTTSFGKLYWDSDDHSRIFYDMEVKDSSRRSKEVTEGVISLGLPSRTLSLSGSCSDNKAKQSSDLTFSWDTDRADKQVGIKGSITHGDKIKGDITLSMPSIRKEIRVDSEIAVKSGRIILDAKTDISYSKDSRKTLTLFSKLEDISDYYSHYNYSLAVGVSHPYTNVDIQMTSHLGSSDEKMTIGLSTDYLTARRQNKNLGLLAEINKLKRHLNLQITNPMSKMEYTAEEISNNGPYKVRMLSKVDDVETFRSDLVLDENEKSIELNMIRGIEGLKLFAGYPSLKEFRTEVSRSSYDSETTEAVLAVRLNTTRLMHTRLHWDPDMAQNLLQDIRQRLLVEGIEEYQTFREIKAALSEEITGKYKDITAAFDEEVRPLVDELEKDFDYIERQMSQFLKAVKKAYRNNDFYLQDMGTEAFEQIEKRLSQFKHGYKKDTKKIIKFLKNALDNMLEFPIRERYDAMVNKAISALDEQLNNALRVLESLLANTDAALVSYRERMLQAQQKSRDAVYNSTYSSYVSDALGDVDVTSYVPSWEIPEEYSSALYSAVGHVGSGVSMMMDVPGLRHVKRGAHELYQQGVWAYSYWQLEKNIFKHSENILRLIEEIVRDELSQYAEEIKRVYYPITVWDPEHGEVQAEFRLPVDVTRLDEMPDLSPLAKRFTIYLPEQSTMEAIYEYMPDMWSSQDLDEVKELLAKYKPTKRFRGFKKGNNNRRRKAWAF
ncbi:apolipophorin [Elysia marginata]|uniref:Apolipophorin n=1 Tax=Elysia marginata TaxID=1093978 RepID=A0AAV4HVH1_9GAST|nr:apolipophorin [Elysia marginata]